LIANQVEIPNEKQTVKEETLQTEMILFKSTRSPMAPLFSGAM